MGKPKVKVSGCRFFRNQEERFSSGPSSFAYSGHFRPVSTLYMCKHVYVFTTAPAKQTLIMSDEGPPP